MTEIPDICFVSTIIHQWRSRILIFVFVFLLGVTTTNTPRLQALQPSSAQTRQVRRSPRLERQQRRRPTVATQSRSKLEKHLLASQSQSGVNATQMQLFFDAIEYPTGRLPDSMAVADFNADGVLDLVVSTACAMCSTPSDGSGFVGVLLGNRDGSFQTQVDYPIGVGPSPIAVADFNGDGKPDVVAANFCGNDPVLCEDGQGTVSVLLGKGDGTFQSHVDYPAGAWPTLVVVGDFNSDGHPDLVVGINGLSMLLGNGDGTFQPHVDYPIVDISEWTSMVAGDFNEDGKPDVAGIYSNNGISFYVTVLLGNGDGTFQTHVDYSTGGLAISIKLADFNRDGKQDLAVSNGEHNSVSALLGNGDGTFQTHIDSSTGRSSALAAVADFNADGYPDLAVASSGPALRILLGNGDGTFHTSLPDDEAYTFGSSIASVGDFDGDGRQDLVVANGDANSVSVLLGNGDGTFQTHLNYAGFGGMGDFQGDGRQDLIGCAGGFVNVLLGNGDGTFQTQIRNTTFGCQSALIGDFNSDGKLDLAGSGGEPLESIGVMLGNGDGTFRREVDSPIGVIPKLSLALIGDFNGDGKPDIAVGSSIDNSNAENWLNVLLGNGDGTFRFFGQYPAGIRATSVALGDFNRDGKQDFVVSNQCGTNCTSSSTHGTVSVWLGNGDGTFQTSGEYQSGLEAFSVAVGDFNGDGTLDLAVASRGDSSVGVLLGNGDGTFQTHMNFPTAPNPQFITIADFDSDGRLDLAVASLLYSFTVLLGNGDGTFHMNKVYFNGEGNRGVIVSDFNHDGAPDLLLGTYAGAGILLNLLNKIVSIAEVQSSSKSSIPGQLVTLTATIHTRSNSSDSGTPTGTVTFVDGADGLGTETLNEDGVATLSVDTLSVGTHAITVVYSGDSKFNPATSAVLTQVVQAPDFEVSATSGSATVKAGASTAFTLTMTAQNGFSGDISLTCSVTPAPALAPVCSLTPTSVTLAASGTATSQLSAATTGPTASLANHTFESEQWQLYPLWLPMCGLALLGFGTFSGRSKRKKIIAGAFFVCLLMAGLWTACGGGSNGETVISDPPPPSTPAGSYTITVTESSGSIVHSTAVTVTVLAKF